MTQDQTPSLRFPEFRGAGAWEVKPLNSVLDYGRPDNFFVSSTNYSTEGTPVLTANKSFILGYTKETDGIFKDTPVIIFDDFTTDKKYVDFPFKVKSSAIKILKQKGDDNLKLIFELMNKISLDAKEHKRYYISEYQNLSILLPKPDEQEKIAECLSSLDEVITAQGDRLNGLKDYKRGLMQQLFPADMQTTPTLRFPEFQGKAPWQATKLGEAFNLYQPKTLSRTDLDQNGKYNVYGANGIIGRHNQYNHKNSEVIVTCRGATCGEIHYTEPKVWITGNAMVVNPKNNDLSKRFILYYLKNRDFKHVISGSAQPQITRQGFAPLLIALPPLAEQEKIADCLSSLDELITAQEQKLKDLKHHKNGLMQQLFPEL